MNADQSRAFLKALGAKAPVRNGKWVQSSCPLAAVRHQNHKDSNPSFGLTCEPDKPSRFNCFACGHGSALELIQFMEFYGLEANFALARQILEAEQLEVVPLPEYGEFNVPEDLWVFKPWPELWLTQWPSAMNVPIARAYLHGRQVTDSQIMGHDLRWDLQREMVLFPIREAHGWLAGARGRSVHDDVSGKDKHYDYSHDGIPKNVKGVWYNERALHLPGPVVVVEGQYDLLRVEPVWPKIVANLTALPTAEKVAKLTYCQKVIHLPDNDKTGLQSVAMFQQLLAKHDVQYVPVVIEGVKDPGACHSEFIRDLLQPHL